MDIFATVSANDAQWKAVQEAVKELKKHEVLVGVPQEKSSRKGSGKVTNAELLFIHTNGSTVRGIPPRPVLQPAIEHDKERVGEMLGKAIDVATSGNKEQVVPALERAGMYGANVCKAWFTNPSNSWKPNSEETIARKKSSRPLIDIGEMRDSITYVVGDIVGDMGDKDD